METLGSPKREYMLSSSLTDLHKMSVEWASEIELWRAEVKFFQKLLDQYAPKIESIDHRKELDHFQNLIIYYGGELIDEFRQSVSRHEKHLSALLSDKNVQDEESYREAHHKIGDRIETYSKEFRQFKKELFEFVEKFMKKD